MTQAITLAITGASGAVYGVRLLEQLLSAGCQVHLLLSSAAQVVLATELDLSWPTEPQACQQFLLQQYGCDEHQLRVYGRDDWFSPVASGSAAPKQMVVCPCSMGTLAAIAHGMSDNLIERAADVVLKERGHLLLVPRETPYSAIHLENMLKLTQLGATILPASPGFYHKPQSIDDLVSENGRLRQGQAHPWAGERYPGSIVIGARLLDLPLELLDPRDRRLLLLPVGAHGVGLRQPHLLVDSSGNCSSGHHAACGGQQLADMPACLHLSDELQCGGWCHSSAGMPSFSATPLPLCRCLSPAALSLALM